MNELSKLSSTISRENDLKSLADSNISVVFHTGFKASLSIEDKSCPDCGLAQFWKCSVCIKLFNRVSSLQSYSSNNLACQRPIGFFHYCSSCSKKQKRYLSDFFQHNKTKKTIQQNLLVTHLIWDPNLKKREKSLLNFNKQIRFKHIPRDFKQNKCKKCKKNFTRLSSLYTHYKTCGLSEDAKRSLRRFTCDYCKRKFLEKRVLYEHIKMKHLPLHPSLNRCNKCKKQFSRSSNLRAHFRVCGLSASSKSSLKRFKCNYCQRKFSKKYLLVEHINFKHLILDPNLNKCDKCKKNFATSSSLRAHSKICGLSQSAKDSLKRYTCNYCEKKFSVKNFLGEHIKIKHLPFDPSLNRCDKCKKNFSRLSHLGVHMKICGASDDTKRLLKRFTCNHCDKKFSRKSVLGEHIKFKHLSINPVWKKCEKCKKKFSKSSSLSAHSKICGQSGDTQILSKCFTCDYCERNFSNKNVLYEHIKFKHLPLDPNWNKCDKCKKSFSRSSNLSAHSKICGLSDYAKYLLKRFTCNHCKRKFSKKSFIEEHIKLKHLPFDPNLNKCDVCKKIFPSSSSLRVHSKTCTLLVDAGSFICDHCGRIFSEKSAFDQHMKFEHLLPVSSMNKCDKCHKIFINLSSLRAHSKICGLSDDAKRLLRRFTCDYCESKFIEKRVLCEHIKYKHLPFEPSLNKCDKCKKSFSRLPYLHKHYKICGLSKYAKRSLNRFNAVAALMRQLYDVQ